MNRRQQRDIEQYFYDLAKLLRLSDWTFYFDWETPSDKDEDLGAAIHCVSGRKHSLVRISSDFLEEDAETQRHYLTHELIHCHLAVIDDIIRDDFLQFMKDDLAQAFSALHLSYDRSREYAVDGITDAIAPYLPTMKAPGRKRLLSRLRRK